MELTPLPADEGQGRMRTGEDQRLRVRVVPGSGTDGLAGLSGTMTITIEGREHRYALEYELPDPPP